MFFSNRLAIYSALGIITSTAGVTQLILNAQVPYDIIVSNEMRYGQETNIKLKEGSKIVTNDERVEYLISNNIDNIARHVYYDPINYSLRYQSVLKNDVDIIITAKLDGAVKAEEKITFKGYERSDSKYDYHNFIPTELLEITDFNELVGIKENAYINEYDSLLVSNFVTEISDNSFLNLPNNIKYLVCEENSILTKIGIDAFYNTGLGEIYLDSKNPIAFYDTAFSGLSKLTKFVTAANLQLGASEWSAFAQGRLSSKGEHQFSLVIDPGCKYISAKTFHSAAINQLVINTEVDFKTYSLYNVNDIKKVIINSIFTTETDVIGADIVSDQNVISIENNVEELSTSDVSDLITRMGLKISA